MDEWTDEDGEKFISSNYLAHGDYAGSDDLGRANIRALEGNPESFLEHGPYGWEQLWIPDTPENREIIRGLEEEYPLIDENIHSEVEMELEMEAWDSWIRSDLIGGVPESYQDFIDELDSDILYECYRQAMDDTNTYGHVEGDGFYVRIEDIQDDFNELIIPHLPEAARAIYALEEAGFDTSDNEAMFVAQDWLKDNGFSPGAVQEAMVHLGVNFTGMKSIKSIRLQYSKKNAPDRSNKEGFIAALREDPNDWQTRLIYADFLEESGDTKGAGIEKKLARIIQDGVQLFDKMVESEEFQVKRQVSYWFQPEDTIIEYHKVELHAITFFDIHYPNGKSQWFLCCNAAPEIEYGNLM